MKTAIWIIAICEVIRAAQNMIQIMSIRHDSGMRENAYSEFVKSLKVSDREFVERMLKEFERENNDKT